MSTEPALRLYKLSIDSGGKPEPGKLSEMFLEFAQPLLEIDPNGPPNIQALSSVMMMAELCWNLPVMEARKDSKAVSTRKMFDAAISQVPGVIADVLVQLVDDRTATFGGIPFFLTIKVKGKSLKDARIAAEARMPGGSSKMS